MNFSERDSHVRALAGREDLRRPDGLLDPAVFGLRCQLGPVSCVDSVAIRMGGVGIEGGIIRRHTGRFSGKLALVGGVVAYREPLEMALRRHWRQDLGAEIDFLDPRGWTKPASFRQYCPKEDGLPPGFGEDPGKHSFAVTFLVTLGGGSMAFGAKIGGQEARGFEWYSLSTCPPDSEFGYDMGPVFRDCLEEAGRFF